MATAITPGSGFVGATTVPDDVGNAGDNFGTGKVIARWITSCYQTFTGTFKVGLLAFHGNGVTVEISCNGGAWTTIPSMTLETDNLENAAWAYWCELNSANFSDASNTSSNVEIRARITPLVAGKCRVLQGAFTDTAIQANEQSIWLSCYNSTAPNATEIYLDSSAVVAITGFSGDLPTKWQFVTGGTSARIGSFIEAIDSSNWLVGFHGGTAWNASEPLTWSSSAGEGWTSGSASTNGTITIAGDDAGSGTSNSPYRTMARAAKVIQSHTGNGSGTIVYLKKGSYIPAPPVSGSQGSISRWVVFQPAPGVSRSDVMMWGGGGSSAMRLHFQKFYNLTIGAYNNTIHGYTASAGGTFTDDIWWIDNCDMFYYLGRDYTTYLSGRWNSTGWTFQGYATRTTVRNYAGSGFVAIPLVRNCEANVIRAQSFKDCWCVVDCSAHDLKKLIADGGTIHTDCLQLASARGDANAIWMNIVATEQAGQPLFNDISNSNIAVVNCSIHQTTNLQYLADFGKSSPAPTIDHLLIWNITLPNTRLTSGGGTITNTSIVGVIAYQVPTFANTVYTGNHILDIDNNGTEDTPAGFYDSGSYNFVPTASAAIINLVSVPPVRFDANNHTRGSITSSGAFASNAEWQLIITNNIINSAVYSAIYEFDIDSDILDGSARYANVSKIQVPTILVNDEAIFGNMVRFIGSGVMEYIEKPTITLPCSFEFITNEENIEIRYAFNKKLSIYSQKYNGEFTYESSHTGNHLVTLRLRSYTTNNGISTLTDKSPMLIAKFYTR